jgi:hypothetical protein
VLSSSPSMLVLTCLTSSPNICWILCIVLNKLSVNLSAAKIAS